MDLINKTVTHKSNIIVKSLGAGTIIGTEGNKIKVRFKTKTLNFNFKSFAEGILTADDPVVQEYAVKLGNTEKGQEKQTADERIAESIRRIQTKSLSSVNRFRSLSECREKGTLRVEDEPWAKKQLDALDLFGAAGVRRGDYCLKDNDKESVWFPKIKKQFVVGKIENIADNADVKEYVNLYLDNGEYICELPTGRCNKDFYKNNKYYQLEGHIRYTFCRFQNTDGYLFTGVYIYDKERSEAEKQRYWKRISTEVDLSKYN